MVTGGYYPEFIVQGCPWYIHQKPGGTACQSKTSLLFTFKEENSEGIFENI